MTRLNLYPLAYIFALLPSLASATIMESSPSREPNAACEFYLGGAPDSASALKWLNDRMPSLRQAADVRLPAGPTPEALEVLGLPERLSRARMRIVPPRAGQSLYWLSVQGEMGTIGEFPFELPPVYVWKDVDNFEEPQLLRADVHGENIRKIALGAVIREFEHGRLFVSVRMARSLDRIVVALGIDVDPEETWRYTKNSALPMIIREHRHGFHRIEVLTARFRIRGAPSRNGTGGAVTYLAR